MTPVSPQPPRPTPVGCTYRDGRERPDRLAWDQFFLGVPMLPSLLYAVVRLLLDLALLRCHSSTARDRELLVLRHEVRVLRRPPKRTAWCPGDRLVFTARSRCLPRANGHAFPVRPETLLRWHRELVRRQRVGFGRRHGRPRPALPPPISRAGRSSVAIGCEAWSHEYEPLAA